MVQQVFEIKFNNHVDSTRCLTLFLATQKLSSYTNEIQEPSL